ncbi:MAG: hypothetical protein QME96_11840, partial [Myxococcota bacterium]|nr:hypothetical protein [Myxococcota bacterium]
EGGDGAVAIKRVFVGGGAPPNRNPVVESLEIDGEPLVDADPSLRLPACEAGSCPRRTVRARYAEGSAERFVVVEFGTPRERTEDLYMSWFATAGEFVRIRSGGTEPEVEWVQPEGVGAVVFYFVGHDGRGGQDWAVRRVVVE